MSRNDIPNWGEIRDRIDHWSIESGCCSEPFTAQMRSQTNLLEISRNPESKAEVAAIFEIRNRLGLPIQQTSNHIAILKRLTVILKLFIPAFLSSRAITKTPIFHAELQV